MLRVIVYRSLCYNKRYVHSSSSSLWENSEEKKTKNMKRKVKETVELINLVGVDNNIMGLKPKNEAETLARKLNLSLREVNDPRFGRSHPTFKLMRSSEIFKQEPRSSSEKAVKRLPLNSRITNHDLSVKLNTIRKWLNKKCDVHVAIGSHGDTESQRKDILNKIQDNLKNECRILDIRSKEDVLKFIIMPPKQKPEAAVEKSDTENSKDSQNQKNS